MRKYLIEIIFYFFLPFAAIAVIAEYSIRKIPNDYAHKSKWLTENSQNIKTLCLGPSSIVYDINPVYFSEPGFNAAHVSQTLKYDHFIFNKYFDQMDSLQNVIIGIDYWTPYEFMEETTEWWRIKYYSIHYGCDYHKGIPKFNYELHFHNLRVFSIAFKGFLNWLGLRNETHRTVSDLGYGENYSTKGKKSDWDDGEIEAERHNNLITELFQNNKIPENMEFLMDICTKCAEKDIRVILVNTPLYKSYYNNLIPKYLEERKEFCNYFVNRYDNVSLYNFSTDDRFSEDDYYDSQHLNEIGSKKFTLMLDSIIVAGHSTFNQKVNELTD